MRPLALAAALAAAAGAAQAQYLPGRHDDRIDLIRPDAPELAAHGPHPVGVRTLELVDAGRLDVLNVAAGTRPTYDRPLTVELWHPAAEGTEPGTAYDLTLRDGATRTFVYGRAARGAAPSTEGPFPVVIVSHGYPGNRLLMSPLAENLASKGYVVASIDHTDSTYSDQAAFGSTLVNRPLDTKFVLDEIARLAEPGGPLAGVADAGTAAIVGYSMGAYGAVISAGAGVTQAGVEIPWGAPDGTLAAHLSGSDSHAELIDPRVKAVIAIAPWGWTRGFWDEDTAAGLGKPTLFVAGDADDISGYAPGVRSLWAAGTGAERWLLTFENANHNAAAPMPAPVESWEPVETLDFVPFEHYADPVWDSVRMNNVMQHFATAFLDWQVKGEADMAAYLDLVPAAEDGVVDLAEDGTPTEDHSYWRGFPARSAVGLRLEHLAAGEAPAE